MILIRVDSRQFAGKFSLLLSFEYDRIQTCTRFLFNPFRPSFIRHKAIDQMGFIFIYPEEFLILPLIFPECPVLQELDHPLIVTGIGI